MRDLKFFAILDNEKKPRLKVGAIHDEIGYREIRRVLSDQYNLGNREPNIQVHSVDVNGDRALTLRHYQYKGRPLSEGSSEVLKHVARLWGFTVKLETQAEDGGVALSQECKIERRRAR